MSRSRRIISMVTASIAIVGLGFIVAVASSSRPGQGDEPWLDVSFRADIDLTPIMAWIILIAAVVGAVLLALGLRPSELPERRRGRSLLLFVLGLVIFVVALRWLRPFAESALVDGFGTESSEVAAEPSGGSGGTSLGWVISILLAAVMAAALTRIGLSIRSSPDPFSEPEVGAGERAARVPVDALSRPRRLSDDPRSQIFNAYAEFEDDSSSRGVARSSSETAGRHARRVEAELSLERSDIDTLSTRHADARYGLTEPSDDEANEARAAKDRLAEEMGD